MPDRLARLEAELRLQRWFLLGALLLLAVSALARPQPALLPTAHAGGVTQTADGVFTTNEDGSRLYLWTNAGVAGWRAVRFSAEVPPGSALEEAEWTPSGSGPR